MNAKAPIKPFIVQVMPKEKFSHGFVSFTHDAFPDVDVRFVLYGSDDFVGYVPVDADGVLTVGRARDVILNSESRALMRTCGAIVLNGVNWRIAAAFGPLISKTLLMFWGGDIYSAAWKVDACLPLRASVGMRSKARSIRRAKGIITLIPGDLAIVEQVSASHGPSFQGPMETVTRSESEAKKEQLGRRPVPDGAVRVLLGNSATETNRHISMLEALSSFDDDGLEVYVPLSYGDPEYRASVIEAGERLLPRSFKPLVDFMDEAEYMSFLSSIQVGIFNHNRQQAMGNINVLMLSGAKVYISKDSPMWNDFANEGRMFFATEDITKISSLEELTAYDGEAADKNAKILDPVARYFRSKELWRAIYAFALGGA